MRARPKGDPDSVATYWPKSWPNRRDSSGQYSSLEDYHALKSLIEARSSERVIERFLSDKPGLMGMLMALFSTGHHASWVYPKIPIRPSVDGRGMIPDYVLAGANSDGLTWFILELKGADASAFTRVGKRVSLSHAANRGVCQLLSYIDVAARSQAYLRDEIGLKSFREPTGILLMGTGEETYDEDIQEFKGAWNRQNPNIKIKSYSSFLRQIEERLGLRKW